MKIFFLFLFITMLLQRPLCREKSSHFVNEFGISMNYSLSADLGTMMEPGFGLGIYHVQHLTNNFAISAGPEYNMTRFSFDKGLWDKYTQRKDLTYTLNYLSFPVTFRLTFGKKCKIFAEAGAFFENYLVTISRWTATHNPPPGVNKKSSTGKSIGIKVTKLINYGFITGLAIQLPIADYALIIKTDLIYGLEKNIISDDENEFYNRYAKISLIWKL